MLQICMCIKYMQFTHELGYRSWYVTIIKPGTIFTKFKHPKYNTVDGFIFVGTNFRGLKKNQTFVGFKIRGHCIFLYNSYRKSLFRWL